VTGAAGTVLLQEASPAELRALVAKARGKNYRSGVIGVRARPRWTGPDTIEVEGGAPARVVPCVSALAVRAALLEWDRTGWLILLTHRGDDDLGEGLLAHLVFQRLQMPSLWEAIRDRFQARQLDPLLVREDRQLAETLLAETPPQGWPPVPGGVLTRDVSWAALADRVLGLPRERLDALGLLEWTLDEVRVGSLARLPEPVRDGLLGWLGERTGDIGRCTIDVVRAGHGVDAAPLALVAALLADERVDQVLAAEARGRLAARHGGRTPAGEVAAAWGEAARALVERPGPGGRQVAYGLLDRAQALLAEAGAADLTARSQVLPAGLVAQLRSFAHALHAAVQQAGDGRGLDSTATEAAYLEVTGHVLAELEPQRVGHATMAMRLARWLATPPGEPAATLADGAARQTGDDGWVDRARADVWAGDSQDDPVVAAAYRALYQAVSIRRAEHDSRFAELLAAHTRAGARPGSLLHVEGVLDEVVLPLARHAPVLLLVVDGMSVAVATEVADGAAADGWVECLPLAQQGRRGALAVLPTVTEVSRVSLLSGSLVRGGQAQELEGLTRRAARNGLRAALFHKADLERSAAGEALPERVRMAVQDHNLRLVAVVLNTVDDALDRADPGRTLWNLETISHLRPLLGQARGAGRVVVLTSDHGHVIERRDSELRNHPDAGGARWRPAGPGSAPPGDGEIAFSGPRVLLGGGRVVLPWRETIRYLPLRAGYHGGATPAEAVVLASVHVAGPTEVPPGWEAAPPQAPSWWLGSPAAPSEPTGQAAPSPRRPRRAPPTLFDQLDAGRTEAPEPTRQPTNRPAVGDGLVAALLASPVYEAQRERARRVRLDEHKVAAMVGALLAAHGRLPQPALAAAAGIPEFRLPGVMSALQRLLNVDGYEVVGYDLDGETVVLDRPLLQEQFRLQGPDSS
jgi:hypothetical protein